ncbi:MAG: glycerophosphodiester phosphodiesterase family protein, partial [Rhodothermales bacterium]
MTPASFDIQGHRGARGLYPENTIPGFLAALDLGIPTLEMDVVISRDERVVVSHDPWMARSICKKPDGSRIPILRERSLRIYEMPYREIAEYDCGTLPSKEFKEQAKIPAAKPLLLDVLESSERHIAETGRAAAFYSIETKSRPEWDGIYHPDPETFTRLLIAVLEDAGVTDRAIVQSFDVRTLRHVKRMNPSMRLS